MVSKQTRRFFLKSSAAGVAAVAATPLSAIAQEQLAEEPDFDDLFLSDMEPLPADARRSLRTARSSAQYRSRTWSKLPEPRPEIKWFDGQDSTNYRHLNADFDDAHFEFSAQTLKSLCESNSFQFPPLEAGTTGAGNTEDAEFLREFVGPAINEPVERVLFGLRGCEIVEGQERPDGLSSQPVLLREAAPDHRSFNCVMGVWDRETDEFWLSEASTVPNADYMSSQTYNKLDRVSNMMPTGKHRYVVGPHRRTSKYRQPGALILSSSVCVLRTLYSLGYSIEDYWDTSLRNPYDNIHATYPHVPGSRPVGYSSAGCQVIPGWYNSARSKPTGSWADFRELAGLKREPDYKTGSVIRTKDDGREFDYVLLTGREARLASQGSDDVSRIRLGSESERIGRIRSALGVTAGVTFDGEAMRALLHWQREMLGFADGVLTPEMERQLTSS